MGEPLLPGVLEAYAFDESQLTRRLSFSNWSMESCRTRPRNDPAQQHTPSRILCTHCFASI